MFKLQKLDPTVKTGVVKNGPKPTILAMLLYLSIASYTCGQVFAWDEDDNSYDKNYGDGRSYISVISEVIVDSSEDCVGKAKNNMGEARMDIVDSEMGYLGYDDSEAYGLVWKVCWHAVWQQLGSRVSA